MDVKEREFLKCVDLDYGIIKVKILPMVRHKAIDYSSDKRERKGKEISRHFVGIIIDNKPEESNPFCPKCEAVGIISRFKERLFLDDKGTLLIPINTTSRCR